MGVVYEKGCVTIVVIERELTQIISDGNEWESVRASILV